MLQNTTGTESTRIARTQVRAIPRNPTPVERAAFERAASLVDGRQYEETAISAVVHLRMALLRERQGLPCYPARAR